MASLDGTVSNIHISPLDNKLYSDLPAGTSTTDVVGIELVTKRTLTAEQRNQMNLLGMDPNDTTQVDLYLKMSPDEIQTQLDAVMNNLHNTNGVSNEPDRVSSGDSSDAHVPAEPQTHVHNFKIDTNSPIWENMSNRQRIKTFLTSGARAQFSDEQWNSMTNVQRKAAIENFTEQELEEHYPNFAEMSEVEQLEAGSDFLNLMNIADANDMDLKDLLALKKNSPEQFEELSSMFYENHTKVDLVKDTQNRREARAHRQFEELRNGVIEYAQDNDLQLNTDNRVAVTFAYLESEVNSGSTLRGVKKHTYKALQTIKALNNGSLEDIKAGNKTLVDLLKDEPDLERDNEGNVEFTNPANRRLIVSKIAAEFAKCKTDEERLELFQSYGIESQAYILSAFSHSDGNRSVKSILRAINGGSLYMASVDGESSNEDQTWYATDGLRGLHEHNKGNISEDGIKVVAATVKEFEAEPAALANVTSYELDENLAKATTDAIGEREDAKEVFEISNPLIAESDKISDEMKQFYAQNTIEVLKSPEDRQSQANSLGKYNLDSFNKGVQKGYENIANGTASGSGNTSSTNNVSAQNVPTKICQNLITSNNPEVLKVQQDLKNLDLTKSEDVEIFLDIVDKYDVAISNYLAGCSQKDKEDFITAYCSKANPKQIIKFLQSNKSLYKDILNISGTKLAPYKEQIFEMLLLGNDKIIELASVLDIDLAKFARAHGNYAPYIAIETGDKELARSLVTNPVEYNFNLGDARAPQLRQLASTGNIPERINNNRHFEWAKA